MQHEKKRKLTEGDNGVDKVLLCSGAIVLLFVLLRLQLQMIVL